MKWVTNLIVLVALFLSGMHSVVQQNSKQDDAFGSQESFSGSFMVRTGSAVSDAVLIQALEKSAAETGATVCRFLDGAENGGQIKRAFCHFSRESDIKAHFCLSSGQVGDVRHFRLSTPGLIGDRTGTLCDYLGDGKREILPLNEITTYTSASGNYSYSGEPQSWAAFQAHLASALPGIQVGPPENPLEGGYYRPIDEVLPYVIGFLLFLVVVATLYWQVKLSRDTGILRLNGYSYLRTYFSTVGLSVMTVSSAVLLITPVVVAALPGSDRSFVLGTELSCLRTVVIILVSTLLTQAINMAPTLELIKGRKFDGFLFWFNIGLKVLFGLALSLMLIWNIASWRSAAQDEIPSSCLRPGYGVFAERMVGADMTQIYETQSRENAAITHELYRRLNDKGALYIDTTDLSRRDPSGQKTQADLPIIRVNPN